MVAERPKRTSATVQRSELTVSDSGDANARVKFKL